MPLSGRCRCGTTRYTLAVETMPATYACHCLDCQTMSGSAFVLQAPVRKERLSVEGELTTWKHNDSRGNQTSQRFCAICMTRIYSTNSGRRGVALLRVGTLDISQEVVPTIHIWTKRKQHWVGLPEHAETYDEAIPPERAMVVFAPDFQ